MQFSCYLHTFWNDTGGEVRVFLFLLIVIILSFDSYGLILELASLFTKQWLECRSLSTYYSNGVFP
jgi:hypothetical protein